MRGRNCKIYGGRKRKKEKILKLKKWILLKREKLMTLGAERKLNKKVNLGERILDYEVQLKGKKKYKLRFKISVQY